MNIVIFLAAIFPSPFSVVCVFNHWDVVSKTARYMYIFILEDNRSHCLMNQEFWATLETVDSHDILDRGIRGRGDKTQILTFNSVLVSAQRMWPIF